MKNLPDKFPIRYAIVVEASALENQKDYQLEILIDLLKKNPLSLVDTYIRCDILNIFSRHQSINLIVPEKANAKPDLKELRDCFVKNYIDLDIMSMNKIGYKLSLISYAGLIERPAFLYFKEHPLIDVNLYSDSELQEKIPLLLIDSQASDYKKRFDDIQLNRDKDKVLDMLYKNKRAQIIEIPSSLLWSSLDQNEIGIYSDSLTNDYCRLQTIDQEISKKSKIKVCICTSWTQLFNEEIIHLYQKMDFCNNPHCGHALSFNQKGYYCLKGSDNYDECNKERERNRHRKPGSQNRW